MTIAIGLLCTDGVVLASDTEETWVRLTKRNIQKIHCYSFGRELTCTVTGATSNVDLLRMFASDVNARLRTQIESGSTSVPDAAQDAVKKIFDTNILPLATFPTDQVPLYDSLIGVFNGSASSLYKVGLPQTLVEIGETTTGSAHVAIGIGSMIADDLLDRFHTARCDVDTAADLAVYILRHVKDVVQDCDGYTDVVIQDTGGLVEALHPNYVEELEKWYTGFDEVVAETLEHSIKSTMDEAASFMHSQLLQIARHKPQRRKSLRIFRESDPSTIQ